MLFKSRIASSLLCAIGFGTHCEDHIMLLHNQMCIFESTGCCQFMFVSLLCANDPDKIVAPKNCYISKKKKTKKRNNIQ